MNCKLIIHEVAKGKYIQIIRCSAGKWKKKSGREKYYKYSTVIRRCLNECQEYSAMGESESYIRELRKNLQMEDEFLLESNEGINENFS